MFLEFKSLEEMKPRVSVRNSNLKSEELHTLKQQYEDLKEAMDAPDGRTKEECVRAFQYWLDTGQDLHGDFFTPGEKEMIMRQLEMPF